MMARIFSAVLLSGLAAGPAMAATGPFFSLRNTDFIVLLGFLLFVGILLYYKVPALLAGLLDKRAATIRAELEEARALREEAKDILATYEQKSRDVQQQADAIVAAAKRDAISAAEQAKADLEASITRRLRAAEEQIASAESAALRQVKDRAVAVAMAAAGEVLARQFGDSERTALADAAIADVETRFH